MAKRSNNFRSKKIQASKPYDVSNSFVKKVASRVTELLPQSIWPTKWFSSANHEIHPHGNGKEALNSPLMAEKEDDTDQNPTPAKRARIPLNSSFSDQLFNPSTAASDYEAHRLRHPLPSGSVIDDGLGEPVAGPSGIQRQYHSAGISDSSIPKSRDSFNYNTKKLEINGEDHSDSSESTSGCSSLPQGDHNTEMRNINIRQPETKEPQFNGPEPVNRTSVKRRYAEAANYSSMAVHSSRLFSGIGRYSPPSRATPVPVGRRRNPSFNPDAFGPQQWSGERTNIKDRIVNSPFYSGRTTYGGVSAYQSSLNRTVHQSLRSGRNSIQVRPVNTSEAKGSSSGMSSTARRILEALEMFSSPIQDAKRIPLDDSVNIKRRKVLANLDFSQSSLHSSQSSTLLMQDSPASMSRQLGDFAPPVRELIVPTVPDILAMRRRQKLQGSTVAARQAANESSMLSPNIEKDTKCDCLSRPYPDKRSSGRSGGKIKSKEDIDEEPHEEPDLPNIALPITSLPKFDFILLPACPPPHTTKHINSSTFKFSSPIAFSSASETLVSSNNFTFSSPLKAPSKDTFDSDGPKINLGSANESVKKSIESGTVGKGSSFIEKGITNKEKVMNFEGSWSKKNTELKSCGEGSGLQNIVQGNFTNFQFPAGGNLSEKSAFGEKFKPAAGSWECGTCMVRNSGDVSKCVACETPKSLSSKGEIVETTRTVKETKYGFGDRFKPPSGSWSCDICLVQNTSAANKCQACETPKSKGSEVTPGSENSKTDNRAIEKSSFGEKFRKPDGAWDCTICLVRNKAGGPPKCVACEAPKPGAEPTEAATSIGSTKFSYGNPPDSGFRFGIDKADVPKKDGSGEAQQPTFTFGSTSTAVPGGFTFGVNPKSEEGSKEVSGFIFGTSAATESSASDSSKKPPKFMFGVKELSEKSSPLELTKVQSESETKDSDFKILETKASKEPEFKFGVGAATPVSSGIGMSPVSSKSPVVADSKPTFSFASTEDKKESVSSNATISFGGNSAVSKLANEDGKTPSVIFGTPSSSVSNPSVFGTTTPGAGWSASPPFKLGSSPKSSLFPKTTTSTVSPNNNSNYKFEESRKAGSSTFKFGDAPKAESTNIKFQEVPKTVSSNFKFQEPPKTTTPIFKFEEKPKTTSVAAPSLPSSTIASNPFSSGSFSGLNKDKTPTCNGEPISMSVSSTSVLAGSSLNTAAKTSNAGPMFMFGSGSSSQATAFNLTGQKQPAPTATASTEQPAKPFASNIGTTPNIFGNLSSKAPVFGSASSAPAPSPAATSLPTATSETRSVANSAFVSPTSNPIFGSSVSSTVTATSTTTTATVSSASSTFGSSIFGSAAANFSAVASTAPAFGSSNSAPLAAFGVAQSSSTVFGMGSSTSSNAPFSFSAGAKSTTEEQQPPQAANAPFVFGGGAAPATQPFTFNAAPNKPAFSFGSSTVGAQPVVGTNAPAPATGTAPALGGFSFGDASKGTTPFGSAQPATSIAGGTSNPFGSSTAVPVANITPAASTFGAPLGEGNAAASGTFGAPTFNFGNSQSNPVFSFNSNQPGNMQTNIAQAPAFNFGQAPQPSAAPQQQVTFNPNMPPSFNFTGGATPQFTATPGVLNTVPAANPMPRRFKKAVRRSQQPR